MTDPVIAAEQPVEPELRKRALDPKGVLQKNLKPLLYLGVALLVILAAVASSHGKKTPAQVAAEKSGPPQPMVQDNTDNNIQDLKNQLDVERQKEAQQAAAAQAAANDPALALATPAQRAMAASYGPTGQPAACVPGQPCSAMPYPQAGSYAQPGGAGAGLSPEQQAAQQLAVKEREKAFDSRFSSNLAYSQAAEQPLSQPQQAPQGAVTPTGYAPQQPTTPANSSLVAARAAGDQPTQSKRAPEVNIDSASGQPYVLYEGSTVDTVLMNRLDGDAVGPVKVLVSNPIYSHDHQHVLIPDGTIVLGEAKKIGSSGFGQAWH